MSGTPDLVNHLFNVRLQIEQLQEYAAGLEAAIAARTPEGDVLDENGKAVAVVKPPGLSFRKEKAKELIPEEDVHKVCEIVAHKVKKYNPDLYESCREVGGGTSRIEIVE